MRSEQGTAAVELIGMLPLMLLAALLVWQALLITSAATAAEHAARNASRAASTAQPVDAAGLSAVPSWLRDDTLVQRDSGSTEVTVRITVPLVAPGLASPWTVVREADLPRTG
jgi:hypothetical protein